MPAVGPYDHFAVNWGYRQFARDADEKAELEKITKVQIDQPMYRFGNPNAAVDSTQQTEDLGSNAVEATRLGLLNLERVAGYLVKATSKPGANYDLLSNGYDALLAQWNREMGHVANVVGGVQEVNLYYGDADQRYFPNPAEYQQSAVDFLLTNALNTPTNFIARDIVDRLTAEGVAQRVLTAQTQVLRNLTSPQRINRLTEIEQRQGASAYPAAKLFGDLRAGLFRELRVAPLDIDLYRRNLQRSYVDLLASHLKNPAANSDLPALARLGNEAVRQQVQGAGAAGAPPTVQAHLKDLLARIARALDVRAAAEQGG